MKVVWILHLCLLFDVVYGQGNSFSQCLAWEQVGRSHGKASAGLIWHEEDLPARAGCELAQRAFELGLEFLNAQPAPIGPGFLGDCWHMGAYAGLDAVHQERRESCTQPPDSDSRTVVYEQCFAITQEILREGQTPEATMTIMRERVYESQAPRPCLEATLDALEEALINF